MPLYKTIRQQLSCHLVETRIGFSHEVKFSTWYGSNKMITDIQITKAKDQALVNSFWLLNSQRASFGPFFIGGNQGIGSETYSAQRQSPELRILLTTTVAI